MLFGPPSPFLGLKGAVCRCYPPSQNKGEESLEITIALLMLQLLLFLYVCNRRSSAFVLQKNFKAVAVAAAQTRRGLDTSRHYHPAVDGWEEKYIDCGGKLDDGCGPRIISDEFNVHAASESELLDLDVKNWPTWTTANKEKWNIGNLVADKDMPYGELSYVISGKLEITPQSTERAIVVSEGDFVTFPRGFVASWKVLEELTWHYYLY